MHAILSTLQASSSIGFPEIFGVLAGIAAFAAVLYAPGYIFAFAGNLFGFRRLTFLQRSQWAIAYSFCLAPCASYLAARRAGLAGVCWSMEVLALATLVLLVLSAGLPSRPRMQTWLAVGIAAAWIAFVLFTLMDATVGRKLYFSVVLADQSYRVAFTEAVLRTGVPPANPLYFSGGAAPMRYYYFWYILCAITARIAHISAQQAFIASSVWAGFGLFATIALYARNFFRWTDRQRWMAFALVFVTGADLVPALCNAFFQPTWNGDIEWWSVDPVDGWPDSILWVPHHVAGLMCCLLSLLLLWHCVEKVSRKERYLALAVAAAAFSSAIGLSIYVPIGFAVVMAAWLIRLVILRQPECRAWWRYVSIAAVGAAMVSAPFLLEVIHITPAGTAHGAQAGTHMLTLSVRQMIDPAMLTSLPVLHAWNNAHPVLLDQMTRLVLLVPGLALELGLYGAVFVLLLRARWRKASGHASAPHELAFFFTVAGLLVSLFIGSAVIKNNDFGYRAVMLPQFFLLLLAADVFGDWSMPDIASRVTLSPRYRKLLQGLFLLGLAGTAYGALLLRIWLPIEASSAKDGFQRLPADAFQLREAFQTLRKFDPSDAVLSFHPLAREPERADDVVTPNEFFQRLVVMHSDRQMLNAEGACAVQFGGDASACAAVREATERLYTLPVQSAETAADYCHRFGVRYLLLSYHDAVAGSAAGWPTMLPVTVQEPGFRILRCDAGR